MKEHHIAVITWDGQREDLAEDTMDHLMDIADRRATEIARANPGVQVDVDFFSGTMEWKWKRTMTHMVISPKNPD